MGNLKIYLILVAVMFTWGFNVSVMKILVDALPPLTITSFRIFTAGIFVFIVLSFTKLIRKPTRKEIGYIFLGSVFSVVAHHYFLAIGLKVTSAANSGLILGLGPLLTAFLAMTMLRQMPTIQRFLGFLLGAAGVAITVLAGDGGLAGMRIGDLYVFLSIFSQALSFIVISKASRTLDPRLLTGYMLIIGAVSLFFLALWNEPNGLNALSGTPAIIWLAFFASAVFATAIGHMVYNYAISKVGAGESAIFLNLNTFFALLGAVVLLNEAIHVSHLVGLLFIVSGVLLGSGAVEELVRRRKERIEAHRSVKS